MDLTVKPSLQSLKRTFREGRLWLVLFLPMIVVGLVALILSWRSTGWASEIWMNLGFLALGVLITVFYVEWLVNLHEADRWSKPRAIASIRLRRSATRFISGMITALEFDPFDERIYIPAWHARAEPLNHQNALFNNPEWIEMVRNEVILASGKLESSMDSGQLAQVMDYLAAYQNAIGENLSLLQGYLSPRQVENLSTILDTIPEIQFALRARINGNDNIPGPRLTGIVARSLDLIEESNANPAAYVPSIEEIAQELA
jgi:hypothetical protein